MPHLDALIISFSLACSLTDILQEKIYNSITFPVFLAGFMYHVVPVFYPAFDMALLVSLFSYLAFGMVWFFLWFFIYQFQIISGGDLKFFMALYAWVGLPAIFPLSAFIIMASGVLALIYMLEDGRLKTFIHGGIVGFLSRVPITQPDINYQKPLGFAMFMGTWAYILWK